MVYGHLLPITKIIQVRRTRHAGHCWRSRDELISDVLLWTPTYGRAKAGRPPRTYIQQLCEDTGCSLEDLPEAMNDWEKWRERARDICAGGTTWWWWWYMCVHMYVYMHITVDIWVSVGTCMYVCICIRVYTYRYSCKLTIGMYICMYVSMCLYVDVDPCRGLDVCVCVCVCYRMYFAFKPFIHFSLSKSEIVR